MPSRLYFFSRRLLLFVLISVLAVTICEAQMITPRVPSPIVSKVFPVLPTQDKVDKSAGIADIIVYCYNGTSASFDVTLYNNATGQNYYFTSTIAEDSLGVVPEGNYTVFMSNPTDHSTWWNYYACGQSHYGNTADFFNVPINMTWRVLEINQ